MKLNLLPKTVDTASRSKRALLGGIVVFAASLVGAIFFSKQSADQLTTANGHVESARPKYEQAVRVAKEADDLMASPQLRQMVVNTALAREMMAANGRYPALYDFVRPYIPAFFRITSLTATPIDAETCTVNMTGVVKNAQEYADLSLALMRIPGATSVSRAGFQAEDLEVPALTEIDQAGKVRKPSQAPIPDDGVARLAWFENETTQTGYLNSGGFGDTTDYLTKTVRPGESLINVSVVVPRNIQTPNPRGTIQTLQGTGGGGGGTTTPTPASVGPGGRPNSAPTGSPANAKDDI